MLHARWGHGRQPLAVSPQTGCAHGARGSLNCLRTSRLVLHVNGFVMVDIMAIHAPHVQLIIGVVLDWRTDVQITANHQQVRLTRVRVRVSLDSLRWGPVWKPILENMKVMPHA